MNRRKFIRSSTLGIVGAGALGEKSFLKANENEDDSLKIKEYRTLGRTGFKVSDISLGGGIDESLLNALLNAGINYIDTAESYGNGQAETTIGRVLKRHDRKQIFITTKQLVTEHPGMPVRREDVTKEAIIERFRKSLERLQTNYADCLMIHGGESLEDVKHAGFHAAVKQLKADGRLKYAGISHHGAYHRLGSKEPLGKVLLAAAEDGRFDVYLMAYNFLNHEQSGEVLRACKEKNIGTTLMKTNPVGLYFGMKERIAKLENDGKDVPEPSRKTLAKFKAIYEEAEGFLRKHNLEDPGEIKASGIKFCLDNPNVNSICVSFRNFDDLEKYVRLSGTRLTPTDEAALGMYSRSFGRLYCRHACGLCESRCPNKVPVNTIMRYNHYFAAQGREKYAMEKYASMGTSVADQCRHCAGPCESACPHDVPVQTLLSIAHEDLTLA